MDDETERKLRRLALAGRLDEVRAALLSILDTNAEDQDAKAELQRLINGKPLRLTLSAEERRALMMEDDLQSLQHLTRKLPMQQLKNCNREQLVTITDRFSQFLTKHQQKARQLPAALQEYLNEAKKRLSHFTKRTYRKVLLRTGLVFSVMGIAIALNSGLKYNATSKYETLHTALANNQYDSVLSAMHDADSGIVKYYCPQVSSEIDRAQLWIQKIEDQYRKLDKEIAQFELGHQSIAKLTPLEQVSIESAIHSLLRGKDLLLERWNRQCQKENAAIQARKQNVQQELEQPLPTAPQLKGVPVNDLKLVEQYVGALQTRLAHVHAATQLYSFEQDFEQPLSQRLESALRLKQEIQHIVTVVQNLRSYKNYSQYLAALQTLTAHYYREARPIIDSVAEFPTMDDVAYAISVPGREFPMSTLLAARDIIVHGKSSFPAAFPATVEMVQIPTDLFTAPSYQYKVYALQLTDTQTWYSTIQPEIDATNFVKFRRSSIDPAFTPEENVVEFINDGSKKMYTIDATRMLRDLNLEQHSFFISTNIPRLLTQVLNYKRGKQPALAQAYIYYCLLKMTDASPYPLLNGVRFSPKLREHTESFLKILKKHQLKLSPGCWLSTSASIRRAEKDFADWFQKNRGHDYAAEMANRFTQAYSGTPYFCGYIDERGRLMQFISIPLELPVWIVSREGLRQIQLSNGVTEALPFSPVFINKEALKKSP